MWKDAVASSLGFLFIFINPRLNARKVSSIETLNGHSLKKKKSPMTSMFSLAKEPRMGNLATLKTF